MSREPRDARATQVLSRYWKNPSAAAENGRNASNRAHAGWPVSTTNAANGTLSLTLRDDNGHSDAEIQAHAALFRSNIGNTDFTHNCVMLTQIFRQ